MPQTSATHQKPGSKGVSKKAIYGTVLAGMSALAAGIVMLKEDNGKHFRSFSEIPPSLLAEAWVAANADPAIQSFIKNAPEENRPAVLAETAAYRHRLLESIISYEQTKLTPDAIRESLEHFGYSPQLLNAFDEVRSDFEYTVNMGEDYGQALVATQIVARALERQNSLTLPVSALSDRLKGLVFAFHQNIQGIKPDRNFNIPAMPVPQAGPPKGMKEIPDYNSKSRDETISSLMKIHPPG